MASKYLIARPVTYDLSTDSWSQLPAPHVAQRISLLRQRAREHVLPVHEVLAEHIPFRNIIVTARGRDAEACLFSAFLQLNMSTQSEVPQNILFHTARERQLQNGMIPVELPIDHAFYTEGPIFKGDIDLNRLEQVLQRGNTRLIYIEALSNAVGGRPCSLTNLLAAHALARRYSVPLYLDATRVVDNCLMIQTHEAAFSHLRLYEIMQMIFSCCDGITASLVKNFGVNRGGLLATHSDDIAAWARTSPSATTMLDEVPLLLAQSLDEWNYIEESIKARVQQVRYLAEGLMDLGLPVRVPVGAHCIILDLTQLPQDQQCTVPVYLRWLNEHLAIGAAAHWGGLQLAYQRPQWIRLAVPIGLTHSEIAELLDQVGVLMDR